MSKLVSAVSLVVGLTALGFALSNRHAEQVAPAPAPPPRAGGEVRALERRVELLEETSAYLERKVFELGQRPVVGADGGVTVVAVESRPAHAEGALAPPIAAPVGAVARSDFKEAVRVAQDELDAERRRARVERFQADQARLATTQKERWKKFTTEARLDSTQEQQLNGALEAEEARRKALMDQVRSGDKSFFDVRGDLRESRTETDRTVSKVLNQEQLQKYTEVRREERREQRGPGGGDGPTGGGPGPRMPVP